MVTSAQPGLGDRGAPTFPRGCGGRSPAHSTEAFLPSELAFLSGLRGRGCAIAPLEGRRGPSTSLSAACTFPGAPSCLGRHCHGDEADFYPDVRTPHPLGAVSRSLWLASYDSWVPTTFTQGEPHVLVLKCRGHSSGTGWNLHAGVAVPGRQVEVSG